MSFKNVGFSFVMLLITALALSFSSCPKSHPNLPAYDEFGHLSAEIDGEHWYPESYFEFFYDNSSHGASFRYNNVKKNIKKNSNISMNENGTFMIEFWGNNDYDEISFNFEVRNVTEPGIYPITNCNIHIKNKDYYEMIPDYSSVEFDEIEMDTMMYYDPDDERWHVAISDSSYVSGAFQFRCKNEKKTVRLTNGKFRMENKSYNN